MELQGAVGRYGGLRLASVGHLLGNIHQPLIARHHVLQGGGEAGPEAVTPIETLKQYMGEVLDDRLNRINNSNSYIDKVIDRLDRVEKAVRESMNIELDGERMSKKLAPYNDSVNGLRSQLDERGVLV